MEFAFVYIPTRCVSLFTFYLPTSIHSPFPILLPRRFYVPVIRSTTVLRCCSILNHTVSFYLTTIFSPFIRCSFITCYSPSDLFVSPFYVGYYYRLPFTVPPSPEPLCDVLPRYVWCLPVTLFYTVYVHTCYAWFPGSPVTLPRWYLPTYRSSRSTLPVNFTTVCSTTLHQDGSISFTTDYISALFRSPRFPFVYSYYRHIHSVLRLPCLHNLFSCDTCHHLFIHSTCFYVCFRILFVVFRVLFYRRVARLPFVTSYTVLYCVCSHPAVRGYRLRTTGSGMLPNRSDAAFTHVTCVVLPFVFLITIRCCYAVQLIYRYSLFMLPVRHRDSGCRYRRFAVTGITAVAFAFAHLPFRYAARSACLRSPLRHMNWRSARSDPPTVIPALFPCHYDSPFTLLPALLEVPSPPVSATVWCRIHCIRACWNLPPFPLDLPFWTWVGALRVPFLPCYAAPPLIYVLPDGYFAFCRSSAPFHHYLDHFGHVLVGLQELYLLWCRCYRCYSLFTTTSYWTVYHCSPFDCCVFYAFYLFTITFYIFFVHYHHRSPHHRSTCPFWSTVR